MSVVIAMEEVGPCRQQLTIEVPAPAVDAEFGRVAGEFRQQVALPGFRRGKVPNSMVLKKFKSEIEKEVADRLIPRYWNQAQAEKSLDPLMAPRVEELNFEPGAGMTFTASVETRPRIEIGELPAFDLPSDDAEPTEAEIDEAIDNLRRQHSTWVPVQRSAGNGDLVVGTLEHLEDGEPVADEEPRPYEVEIGDERVWEELGVALTGLAAGQKATFDRTEGEGEEAEKRTFRAAVTAVKERELPEVDDELVARFGEFDSVEAWREVVVEKVGEQKRDSVRKAREGALLKQLRDRYPLQLPTGVVDHEIEDMMRDYGESLARQGIDLEKVQLDWERMAEEFRPQAEGRVHVRLLLDAVAESEEVRVDEEEFERLLGAIAASQQRQVFELRRQLSESGRLELLRAQMRRDRTVRQLLGELDAEPAEAAEGSEAADNDDEDADSGEAAAEPAASIEED